MHGSDAAGDVQLAIEPDDVRQDSGWRYRAVATLGVLTWDTENRTTYKRHEKFNGTASGNSSSALADGHAKWLNPLVVSRGYANGGQSYLNPNPTNCGSTTANNGGWGKHAAITACTDATIAATFNLQ